MHTTLSLKAGKNSKNGSSGIDFSDLKFYKHPDYNLQEEITSKVSINYGLMKCGGDPSLQYCSVCLESCNQVYPTQMDSFLKWKNGNLEDSQLREFLRRIWGDRVDLDGGLLTLSRDPNWRRLSTNLCLSCHLKITESEITSIEERKAIFRGKGIHKKLNTRNRFINEDEDGNQFYNVQGSIFRKSDRSVSGIYFRNAKSTKNTNSTSSFQNIKGRKKNMQLIKNKYFKDKIVEIERK